MVAQSLDRGGPRRPAALRTVRPEAEIDKPTGIPVA
jgi:hypothetical protein